MTKHNPTHPGGFILRQCIEPSGLSLGDAAKQLGVAKKELDDFVNCRVGVTVDLAMRLERVFGSTAETWCKMQIAHDRAKANQCAKNLMPSKPLPKLKPARQRLVAK